MYRYTTPTIILKIKNEDFDMEQIDVCHVTVESERGGRQYICEHPEIDTEEKTIMFEMSQEDTKYFDVGMVKIQIRIKLYNGRVIPSKIVKTTMNEILEEQIL